MKLLKLSEMEEDIKKWIQSKKDWRQNVKNQSLSFINEGLKDRAITRDLSWGIDIPVYMLRIFALRVRTLLPCLTDW